MRAASVQIDFIVVPPRDRRRQRERIMNATHALGKLRARLLVCPSNDLLGARRCGCRHPAFPPSQSAFGRWKAALDCLREGIGVTAFLRLFQCHWIALAALIAVPHSALAQAADADLLNLDIEDLMRIEVTTVSKRAQPLSAAPAAVTVITSEDIRRSGMTSVPELLRRVPGLHVAQIDSNTWAITARGFNSQFANKLLVMIDGRSVYTPLFSGVYWDVQDLLLEDVDRIEVVRGPGGTMWGANAVNGVINIITKEAAQTQGALVSALAGNADRVIAGARYGGAISERAHYRAYVKYLKRDDFDERAGVRAHDEWDVARGGLRFDWKPTDADHLTLQGDYYGGNSEETSLLQDQSQSDLGGGNAIASWSHVLSQDSDVQLRLWYDRTERDGDLLGEDRDTFDLEFQHRFSPLARNDLLWGAGYRLTADEIDSSGTVGFDPEHRTVQLANVFVQDEISVIENLVSLTLGTKVEHNDYTHVEFLPNARALFTPSDRHSFWAAVSRAVRAPSRAENDVALLVPNGTTPPQFLQLNGDRGFDSENLLAFELGYRAIPFEKASIDVAAYYNVYDDLRSLEPRAPIVNFPGPGLVTVPLVAENRLDARGYGVEVSGAWSVAPFWRLEAGYTLMILDIDQDDSADPTARGQQKDTPVHQVHAGSLVDLPWNFELDTQVYWVDNVSNQDVHDYARLDARLGWHPLPQLELSLVGQNLGRKEHDEFGPSFTALPTSVPRSFYGKVTWRY
jgi:iron complex outermembrane recepter protein